MDTRIASLGLLIAIAACSKKPAASAPPPPNVQVAAVEQTDVPIYREWIGTLDGFVNADIRPQVEGYVRKQAYKEGARVTRGDLLFLIDPRSYEAVANRAKATLDQNVAALEKARRDGKRDKQLIAQKGNPQEQPEHDLTAEAEAAANVDSARAAPAQARLNRGWTEVTSPIDGIAGIAQAQVGNLVSTSTVMTTVSQVDPIKATFNISESEYLRSARGTHWAEPARGDNPILELILEDGSVYPQRGTVVVTNRQVDPRTGTITLQGAFPNPGNLLRPGQYGKVRAAIETRKGALVVPQRAISELQGSYQVGVVGPDAKVEVRTVRTGEQVGNQLVVEEGVRAGEEVIGEGFARVRPGTVVHATPGLDGSTASATPMASPAGR